MAKSKDVEELRAITAELYRKYKAARTAADSARAIARATFEQWELSLRNLNRAINRIKEEK